MAFGKENGHLNVISQAEDLFPYKWADCNLQTQRKVKDPPQCAEVPMQHIGKAIDLLYTWMGTKNMFQSMESKIDLSVLQGSYLGSSEGHNVDRPSVVKTESGTTVRITSCGQKNRKYTGRFAVA